MNNLNEISTKLYEDIRFFAFRVEHIKADLCNEFKPATNLESKAKERIEENLNSILGEIVSSMDLLNELTTIDSEEDLELLLDTPTEEFSEIIN